MPHGSNNSTLLAKAQELDPKVIRIYPYHRHGQIVLLKACRDNEKDRFRWLKVHDSGQVFWNDSTWRPGRDDVEPCYAYDRAKAALALDPTLELWSVEGERDAETLWDRGYVAVSPADGAREPGRRIEWLDAYVEAVRSLRPHKVDVVADHDAAGLYTAEAVASALEKRP